MISPECEGGDEGYSLSNKDAGKRHCASVADCASLSSIDWRQHYCEAWFARCLPQAVSFDETCTISHPRVALPMHSEARTPDVPVPRAINQDRTGPAAWGRCLLRPPSVAGTPLTVREGPGPGRWSCAGWATGTTCDPAVTTGGENRAYTPQPAREQPLLSRRVRGRCRAGVDTARRPSPAAAPGAMPEGASADSPAPDSLRVGVSAALRRTTMFHPWPPDPRLRSHPYTRTNQLVCSAWIHRSGF